MNCPDPKCRGGADFWRHSLDGLSEIHICGECGGEWGVAIAKKGGGDLKTLGVDAGGLREVGVPSFTAEQMKALQSEPLRITYPMKGQATRLTARDAETLREQAEEMRRFRLAIDEAEFFGEF